MLQSAHLKLGVLGCGRIVTRRVLPAMKDCIGVEIVALASERAGVPQPLAHQFQIPYACECYEELLQLEEVTAVYVPCTGDQHRDWVIAAAEAGKHVLCEKPLALNTVQAEEMVAACRENNVLLQEAFMWRHHPRTDLIRQTLQQGAIGNLRLINISFSLNIDRTDWRLHPERGGGAMWDIGCYGVNACRFFTDAEPVEISADAHWWKTGVDMSMRIGLTFPHSVLANIDCSFEAPFRCRLELVGDAGRIVVDPAFQPGEAPTFQLWRGADKDPLLETVTSPVRDQYACQLEAFAANIRTGRLLTPAENGLQNMRVLEEVLKIARENRF